MKRSTNAFVSIVTALAMVVATCPASALADELGVNDAQVDAAAAAVDETSDALAGETSDEPAAGDVAETSDAATTPAAPLATVDLDAYDDFTLESWSDPVELLTADGETISTAAATAKQKILAAWASCASSVTFSTADGITVADARAAMAQAFADPEYYWASSSYSLSYYDTNGDGAASDTDTAAGLSLYYVVDTANIAAVKSATEAKVAEALTWVDPDNMSDFQVAQALHDYLVRNCVYDSAAASATSPTTSFTAYGALVDGSAVCQGYALAYKLLLSRVGVPCVFVASDSMGHAWNMVQVGGAWYHTDVTWDDPVYPNGTDAGFDAEVSHDYFLRADSTMQNSLDHYGWEAAYTTPASDYANRTYAEYKASVSASGETGTASGETGTASASGSASTAEKTYAHSDTATQGSITLTVQWDDPVMGQPTTFHVSATGGSGSYKYYMAAPAYSSPDEWSFSSVPDPSRGEYTTYSDVCESKDFTFTMTASGTYFYKFYVMDMGEKPYKTLNSRTYVTVADDAYPSVVSIVSDAVAQAKSATDGSEYAMALWLHDWLLDQLEYDNSLTWSSAEAALTRHTGTCQAYTNAYIKLLNAAGITNSETRDTYDGHTWNAVKLDGEWYQVDCTWDDNDDTKYYGFDARHLYFAITDELMAVAHKGHANIYTADGYATRSTSLADNYYVRSGLASQWVDAYAEKIQAKLDAKQTSFSLTSSNAYNPPSIIGIQNAVVAYAMGERTWKAADGAAATLAAKSTVTTESSTKWTAAYDFTVEYGTTATSLAGASVTASDQVFTGSALTPAVTVKLGEKTLTAGTDYDVAYSGNVNAGTATVTVTGKGDYAGTATGTFKIAAADASKATVKVADATYTGAALTPAPTVTLNGKTLVNGTDYTVAYSGNTNAGTATATVTFKGNYSGTATGAFKIAAAFVSSASVSVAAQTYTGSALTPAVTVKLGEKTLTKGTDYTVAYSGNTNAGTANVTITGKGNYAGTKASTFTISAADASKATVSVAAQTYTGSALTPAPTVTLNGKTLVNGTDYTVSHSNNTNAGTATATVTFKGNYTGTAKGTFSIKAADASKAAVKLADQAWTGSALAPAPTVTLNNKTLVAGTDYTVAYANNTNVGTATATVTFKGNYSGTATGTFRIAAALLDTATVTAADQTYTGSALTPAVTVKLGEKTLVSGTDYTVAYSGNVNAGTATVTVTGKGTYAGTATGTFKIAAADASKATVKVADATYSGSALTPAPTVTFNGKTLVNGTDYTVAYANNTSAGTATATVTFKGNYSGTAKATFKVAAASVSSASVSVAAQTYTGSALTPAVTVKLGEKTLAKGTDYTVAYSNNTNAGTASVTITGKGNYTGTKASTFAISAADASKASVSVAAQTYTGSALTPAPTVTFNNKTLAKGTDFDVTYANNTNAGTATATVTFKGNYSGTAAGTFKITAASVSSSSVSVARQTYTGAALTPAATVKLGEKTLVKDTDYTVAYSNNTNAGTASVTITGKGNYTGTKASTFTISAADASKASVSVAAQTYTGSALTPAPTVTLNGKTLAKGTDYTVSYSNNTNAGTATATVTFKGNYTGTAKGTFRIKAADASKATVKLADQSFSAKSLTPAPTVTLNGKTLKQGTDYTVAYANNKNPGTATVTITFKGNYTGTAKGGFKIASASVVYQAHVQNDGWQEVVTDGAVAGTSGRSLRVEALKVSVAGAGCDGGIQIRAHVQDIGWQGWSTLGGTSGQSKRVEAMQLRLTGELANRYDVYYRVHAQNIGWMGWAKNGASAGTEGMSLRLEAIQVKLVPKGGAAPGSTANAFRKPAATVEYQAHVQNIGWQAAVSDGAVAGTSGKSLRVEALKVSLKNADYAGGVQIRAHVQDIGWQNWSTTGGTSGQSKRVEAMQIRLTGEMAKHYDVYYRVHAQNIGWMGWAKNGEQAGTAGYSYRLEAVQVKLVPKGSAAPGSTANRFQSR